jgi:hypothetical protein
VAGDVNGPRCADITDGSAFYDVATDPDTFSADVFVAAASCKGTTYTLIVTDEESGLIYTDSTQGDGDAFFADGTDIVTLSTSVTSDVSGTVCFYVTTTNTGGRVLDRAPDTGCRPVAKGQTGGGSGFS